MKKFALAMGLSLSLCGSAFAGSFTVISRNNDQHFNANYQFCHMEMGKGEICSEEFTLKFTSIAANLPAPDMSPEIPHYVKIISATATDQSGKVIAQGNFSGCSQSYSDKHKAVFILDTVNSVYPVMTCQTSSN